MTVYWIYRNGKKYFPAANQKQAKDIVNFLIAQENEKQNKRNLFTNLSIEVKAIAI